MSKLKYIVALFDKDGEPTSECRYRTLFTARDKFNNAVNSAPCANIGRITLSEWQARGVCGGYAYVTIKGWVLEPELQVAGYVVHSLRTLNDGTGCQPVNKIFHETAEDAVNQAIGLAKKWRDDHEGLIVFKAIKHVHRGNGIVIDEIS